MSWNKNRPYFFAMLFASLALNASAGSLACNEPANEAEAAICSDNILSDFALLAGELGNAVGLEIKYSDIEGTDDFYQRFNRLVETLTIADMDKLMAETNSWEFDFDEANAILFMGLEASPLQDIMIVFGTDGKVAYVASEYAEDAGRYHYRSVGNILEITSSFLPASFTNKFRYQDGCWRLIGQNGSWRDEDPHQGSINHLTGQVVFEYRDGSSTTRAFEPSVSCLGERFFLFDISVFEAAE